VVWLLALFIAIVTQTPQLTWSGAGYVPAQVRGCKPNLDQSAVSKVACLMR